MTDTEIVNKLVALEPDLDIFNIEVKINNSYIVKIY